MPDTISEKIADFSLSIRYENIPKEVINYGKMLMMDTFGVAMSCQKMPHAEAVRGAIQQLHSTGDCTLWGSDETVSMADAVLYNSCLIHGADYDDTHVGGVVHPSSAVVATAVTVGEAVGASGHDMMVAIVAGWEVMVRLALAAKGRFHDVGYHCTGIVAPFASACVAARLMGLDKETLVNAMGICGSQAAGLQEFLQDGTWAKKIHPGWGCHSAVYALLMAKRGFTGPRKVFEGKFGIWNTHLGTTDGLEEQFSDFGKIWHTPQIAFKMYPVCHMTHSFIDCMLALQKEKGLKAEDIESVECRIEKRCYNVVCDPKEAKRRPQSDYMMRFSLPYLVAVAAVVGRVSPWEIDLKYANDPKIQEMIDRIHCVEDDTKKNPGYFPGWLKVVTKAGHTYVREQPYELGTKQNPIRKEDVVTKFNNNVAPFYTKQAREKIVDNVMHFDTLDNAAALIRSLKADR